MVEKIYTHKFSVMFRKITDSNFYPLVVGAIILTLYFLQWQIVAFAVLGILASAIFLLHKDTRAVISNIMLFHLVLCYHDDAVGTKAYSSIGAIIVYAVCGTLVLFSLAYNFFAYRKERKWTSGKLFKGFLGISLAFLVGGLFTEYYSIKNLVTGITLTICYLVVYIVVFQTIGNRQDNLKYVATVMAVAGSIMVLQVLHIYLTRYTQGVPLNSEWKDKVVVGWGISNTVGEFMTMLMPAIFYLIYKQRRGGYYYILVVLMIVAVYLTLSRNALLFGIPTLVCGVIVNCIKGENKKASRIIAVFLGLAGIMLLIIGLSTGLFANLLAFFKEAGFSDRGRFGIWKDWMKLFPQSPIIGVGFRAYRIVHNVSFGVNAHNTLVQMLAGTGILGFLLYAYHRYETVLLFVKKPSIERLIFGSVAIVGVLEALLDPIFFSQYFAIYYTITLLVVEKSSALDERAKIEHSQ